MMTILFTLLHHKQTHMTRIPLELQKQNEDFQTLHEQANKMVYSFHRFKSYFFKYWPNKYLHVFLCNMRNFTNRY